MPETLLTTGLFTVVGPYPGTVAADALNFVFQAVDASNGNEFVIAGREILLVRNSHGSNAITITIDSVADNHHSREGDISTYSLAAGEFMAFSFLNGADGWKQTDGTVHLAWAGSGTALVAVMTLP